MGLQVDSRVTTPVALSSKAADGVATVPSIPSSVSASTKNAGTPIDTLKLSLSAHIHLLKSQGQGAKAIAANLGVPASTVAAYFSAPATSSSSQTTVFPAAPDVDAPVAKVATPAPEATAPVPVAPRTK